MTATATENQVIDLRGDNITIRFGGLVAVDDVTFTIPHGAVVSLIGPNGAGKTTFFNILTGLYHPTSGRVHLGDKDVTGMAPHQVAHLGLARTFQNIGRRRRVANERVSCSTSWASPTWPTSTPATSPTATSAGSRWHAPWPSNRRCCCWTSRPPE